MSIFSSSLAQFFFFFFLLSFSYVLLEILTKFPAQDLYVTNPY